MNESSNGEWRVTGGTSIKSENEPEIGTTKIVGIYGLRCRTTDKWYIGQSVDNIFDRWNRYARLKCKRQRKLYNALVKYGYDSFEKRIIEVCDENVPQDVLDAKETSWIKHFNSVEHGYNLTTGGRGGKKSAETRKRMSLANMGERLFRREKEEHISVVDRKNTKQPRRSDVVRSKGNTQEE